MSDDHDMIQNFSHNLMRHMLKQVRCQEASIYSTSGYIPCGEPASWLIDNGDAQPYLMCEGCADHNVHNRGAKRLARIIVEVG